MAADTDAIRIAAGLREALASSTGIDVALLYGSTARGTATASSDVDVAVVARGTDLLDLGARLTLRLGREVDLLDLDRAPIPVLERIVREGVVVHEGRPGAAASWRSRALVELETDLPGYRRMRDAWLRRVAEQGL